MVARAYNDIIRIGRVTRGSIGVSLDRSVEPEVTLKALGVDHGAIVENVSKGGPADKGGLRAGDIILAVNGTAVKDGDDLISHVADTAVGAPATLSVDRDGKPVSLKVIDRGSQRTVQRPARYRGRRQAARDRSPARSKRRPK